MIVSINIISVDTTVNNIPLCFNVKNISEFMDFIREEAIDILDWPYQVYGSVNNCKLGIHIIEDINDDDYFSWEFIVDCKNIREFKPLMELDFFEFGKVLKSHKRKSKINELLKL